MEWIDGWVPLLIKAIGEAQEREEEVFMADDENGLWAIYLADEEGYTPTILLAVSPKGTLRLIDNSVAGPTEEPWRR